MILACRMHFEKYILAFRLQSLDCAFLKHYIQFCLSLLKSTSPVLVRFFSLPWCNMWASYADGDDGEVLPWNTKELGNEPSNFQETPGTREAALSHSLHPVSQPVQFILLFFFPVSSLISALRSLSRSFLSWSFCAWSSSFYCFLMANPSRFNSTFSLCASWLQFHCQLPNCLPCLSALTSLMGAGHM